MWLLQFSCLLCGLALAEETISSADYVISHSFDGIHVSLNCQSILMRLTPPLFSSLDLSSLQDKDLITISYQLKHVGMELIKSLLRNLKSC